jgi:transcription elongation factor Elf1
MTARPARQTQPTTKPGGREMERAQQRRRARGLCVHCGRVLHVSELEMEPARAVLTCPRCGTKTETWPPSGLFKLARVRGRMERT